MVSFGEQENLENKILSYLLFATKEERKEAINLLRSKDFVDSNNRVFFQVMKKVSNEFDSSLTARKEHLIRRLKEIRNQFIGDILLYVDKQLNFLDIPDSLMRLRDSINDLRTETKRRELKMIGNYIVKRVNLNVKPTSIIETSLRALERVEKEREVIEDGEIEKDIENFINDIYDSRESEKELGTGFGGLDYVMNGRWEKGSLVILAARPSIGKTSLLCNFVYHAVETNHSVLFFSLETPKRNIFVKLLNLRMRRNLSYLTKKGIGWNVKEKGDEMKEAIEYLRSKLKKSKLKIIDRPQLSIDDLCYMTKSLHAHSSIDLLVVDYLQLLNSYRAGNRQQEVAVISGRLKALARDLNIPVICLSQLSRSVEMRESNRPVLSDLRESGSIEQDADLVMFLYRPKKRKIKLQSEKSIDGENGLYDLDENNRGYSGIVDLAANDREEYWSYHVRQIRLDVAKNRNGVTAIIDMMFDAWTGRFTEKTEVVVGAQKKKIYYSNGKKNFDSSGK